VIDLGRQPLLDGGHRLVDQFFFARLYFLQMGRNQIADRIIKCTGFDFVTQQPGSSICRISFISDSVGGR
jgi:hypothetical protein